MLSLFLAMLETEEDRQKFAALYEQCNARIEQKAKQLLKNQQDMEASSFAYAKELDVSDITATSRNETTLIRHFIKLPLNILCKVSYYVFLLIIFTVL